MKKSTLHPKKKEKTHHTPFSINMIVFWKSMMLCVWKAMMPCVYGTLYSAHEDHDVSVR